MKLAIKPSIFSPTWFTAREDGTVTIFGMLMFVLMVVIGGIAIDIMRYETQRVQLQNTVDRAVLAAASLSQGLVPSDVVESYFEASGFQDYRLRILDGEDTASIRELSIVAEADLNTMFMDFFGIRALTTPAYGRAVQTAEHVEISLVLDVSSSMRHSLSSAEFPNRISALQNAVAHFVDTVVSADDTGLVSVNIIPYAGAVNPGPAVFAQQGGIREHNESSCFEFPSNGFDHVDLVSGSFDQIPHFMHFSNVDPVLNGWGWCPDDGTAILYAENRLNVIEDYLDGLLLYDGTATHIGMQYGLALLNPSSQPTFQNMVNNGTINDTRFASRPAAWSDSNTQKYLILVTDGAISHQYRPTMPDDPQNYYELTGQTGNYFRASTRNDNLALYTQLCATAESLHVEIFTIAFESSSNGIAQARDCATDDSYFYETYGDELNRDLASVAATINHLRLTN